MIIIVIIGNIFQSSLQSLAEEKTPIQPFLINSPGTSRSPFMHMTILIVTL